MSTGLGVVVLVYGSGGEHRPLLATLVAEGVSYEQVVVVHNPAAPGEPAPDLPAGCELVAAERNLGFAAGMNLGIARQRERGVDLVLLLTHDARLRPRALERLTDAARRNPDYGALGPALVWPKSDRPFSFGGITSGGGSNSHITERPAPIVNGVFESDWIDGGAMLLRADVLAHAGGFDESFWSYCEEAELCLRIRCAGARVGVVVDALVEQAPGAAKRPGAWSYLMTRNGIAYSRRAAGLRGLFAATARAARGTALNLLRAGLRSARMRPGDPAEPWALAVGAARGAFDCFRGRWGPPPSGLPGMGDLRNA